VIRRSNINDIPVITMMMHANMPCYPKASTGWRDELVLGVQPLTVLEFYGDQQADWPLASAPTMIIFVIFIVIVTVVTTFLFSLSSITEHTPFDLADINQNGTGNRYFCERAQTLGHAIVYKREVLARYRADVRNPEFQTLRRSCAQNTFV
jgi:hypothetical protein